MDGRGGFVLGGRGEKDEEYYLGLFGAGEGDKVRVSAFVAL